jgi:hypothetical protein
MTIGQHNGRPIMTALRLPLFLGIALIAAAGCAQQPKRAHYMAPAATAAAAPQSAATATATQALMSAFPPRLLVFAYDQGWRQVVLAGNNHYFCRTDAPSGSLITGQRCITQADMETVQLLVEQEQEILRLPIPYIPMRYP